MQSRTGIRRVVIVVLDGLRPDAIDRFELRHVEHLMSTGASSYSGDDDRPIRDDRRPGVDVHRGLTEQTRHHE